MSAEQLIAIVKERITVHDNGIRDPDFSPFSATAIFSGTNFRSVGDTEQIAKENLLKNFMVWLREREQKNKVVEDHEALQSYFEREK